MNEPNLNTDIPGWTTDEFLDTPTDDLSEQEALAFLHGITRMQAMLDGARLNAIHRFATLRAGDPRVPGFLAAELKMTRAKAGGDLALAHTLHTRLPRTRQALATGNLDLARARQIDRATTPLTDEQARHVDERILPQACDQNPRQLYDLLRRTIIEADPDGARKRTEARREQRGVNLQPDKGEMWWLHAYLPAEDAIAIDSLIDFVGQQTRTPGDRRTWNQCRADALRDLIIGTHRDRVQTRSYLTDNATDVLGLDDLPRRSTRLRPPARRPHPRTHRRAPNRLARRPHRPA
ncbi:DUF222 domain-containing protein [Amycolatopsis aidingensis]|uniref:DUF222 domain-containing protein n=1 Tax=Amycolatopsis aidingensis TaxID=2842453 RepID=UPI001C0D9490|nr:DUF222 domain-containing protein [Amycolatopsis aidingensis]